MPDDISGDRAFRRHDDHQEPEDDLRGQPLPDHLASFWDGLSDHERRRFSGSKMWQGAEARHDVCTRFCIDLCRARGLGLEDALLLCRFDDGLGSDPVHLILLRTLWVETANQEEKRQSQEEAERAELDAKLAKFFIIDTKARDPATIPPRPWIGPPYVMRRQITLPHGPGGSGKSQLIVAWAIGHALGKQFGRLLPKQRCRVLLTNFEDDRDEQDRRIVAALEYFGATFADLEGWLIRVTIGRQHADATMFDLDDTGKVCATECFEHLELACKRYKPDVVALDPLVAINGVPEGDNTLMRRVMAMLKARIAVQFDVAIILVHHDNKSGDGSDDNDAASSRGASDIVNAVRFELAVKKMTLAQAEEWGIEPDRRSYYFRLGSPASKLNYAAAEESEWFERLAVVVNGEAVVRCIPWDPPSGRLDDDQLQRLIEAVEKGTSEGPYSPQLGNTKRSLTPVLAAIGIETAATQRRALKNLLQSGRVEKAEYKRPGRGNSTRTGLRSSTRLPYNCEWCDVEEADPC